MTDGLIKQTLIYHIVCCERYRGVSSTYSTDFWKAVGVNAPRKMVSLGAVHPEELAPTEVLAIVMK